MPPQGSNVAAPLGGWLGGLRFHVAAWQRESAAPRRKGAPWTAKVDEIDGEIHAPLRVFKKPYKTHVNHDDNGLPDQLPLNGAYWLSWLSVYVVRCCSSSIDRCRCMWRFGSAVRPPELAEDSDLSRRTKWRSLGIGCFSA